MKSPLGWALGLASLVSMGLGGCCFGSTSERVEIEVPELPEPPSDPTMEALSLCLPDAVVASHCTATTGTFPSDTFIFVAAFRTRNLPRFVRPGTILVFEGVGPTRIELGRIPMTQHVTDLTPPPPGEFNIWSTSMELIAPPEGWPVAVPLTVELLDADGISVATTTVIFSGERVPRLRPLPVDVLEVCVERESNGDDLLFCRATPTPIVLGPEHLYVSYSSLDPEVFGAHSQLLFERYVRGRWRAAGSMAIDPLDLAPGHTGTYVGSLLFRNPTFAETRRWRVRLEVNGSEVTAREFEVAPAPEGAAGETHE